LTTIEYALIGGIAAVALLGAGLPVARSLTASFAGIAAALGPDRSCGSSFCIEPAAGKQGAEKPARP
jgi:Flp pilus assembly pilin Flp